MTIFIDASAIVAMIAREPEATSFDERLGWEQDRLTSALAIWEAVRAVARRRGIEFAEARLIVSDFITAMNIQTVTIGSEEAEGALDAHQRFGRGVHPADLNFGDCFAYACAKRHDAALLFKGDDFAQTDIRDATLE